MEHLHEHLPTPHDLRTTIYVSQDGDIVRADPKLFPNALCLLPNCDLNRATSQAQDGGDSSMGGHPAGPLTSGDDMTAAEASGMDLYLQAFYLVYSVYLFYLVHLFTPSTSSTSLPFLPRPPPPPRTPLISNPYLTRPLNRVPHRSRHVDAQLPQG